MVFTIIGISVLCVVVTVKAADGPGCQFWNNLAYNLTHASEQNGGVLQFACNNTCNSISCRGHFKAPSVLSISFEENLCFGLRINHCSNPLSMDYYLIVPDSGLNRSGSISHSDSFDLPGPDVFGTKSTIVVIVEMVRVNDTTIKFGVNSNLRAKLGNLPVFEDKEKVLPEMYINVPPCTDEMSMTGPFHIPSMCTPLPNFSTRKPATTKKLPDMSTQKPTSTNKFVTTQKPDTSTRIYRSCELGVGNCKENEICQAIHDNALSRGGICVCQPGAIYDAVTGACIQSMKTSQAPVVTTQKPDTSTKKSTVTNKPSIIPLPSVTVAQTSKSKSGGINMTAVIIGAVFGGLLLVVVVVSIIIFLGRRRRQANYHGRHQLLSDNEDDDDTNVVI